MRLAFLVSNSVFALLFLVGAAVQLNDPDPAMWVAIYGLAAATCAYALRDASHSVSATAVAVIAVLWSLSLLPQVVDAGAPFGDIAQSMSAGSPGIELLREMLGLLIIAGWMAVIAVRARRRTCRLQAGDSEAAVDENEA